LSIGKLQFNPGGNDDILASKNQFLTANDDIINNNAQASALVQYYYEEFINIERPMDNLNVSTFTADPFTCYEEPGGPIGPEDYFDDINGFYTTQTEETAVKQDITNINAQIPQSGPTAQQKEELAALWYQEDLLLADLLVYLQIYDSLWDEALYLGYLSDFETMSADIIAIKYHVGQSNWSSAQSMIAAIPGSYTLDTEATVEYNDFKSLFDYLDGKDLTNLNSSDVQHLVTTTENSTNLAASWSQALLVPYGYLYTSHIEIPIIYRTSEKAVKNTSSNKITILPNPTTNYFLVNTSESNIDYRLEVYSMDGKILRNDSIVANQRIDISNFNPGLYIARLTDSTGAVIIKKIIKQ
jgi:hypothetical protein